MNILITGGNGYIAKSLYNAFKDTYNVFSISRNDFDLTAFQSMIDFFQGKYYDVVIHCAVSGGSRLTQETPADMDINLAMYYNLLQHKPHYGKLIHFGSGAEIHNPESPYGLSKRIIAKSILEHDNFYNIRIFGVFDENELETRFIKANLIRYIDKQPMLIQDKIMTFFYMKDLIQLVSYYIEQPTTKLLKDVNCAYSKDYSMLEIANFINELDIAKVKIYVDTEVVTDYVSKYNAPYGIDYIGIKQGIQETYNKLTKRMYETI
jgi:nucleoside-diphosphate-sugar epimerase